MGVKFDADAAAKAIAQAMLVATKQLQGEFLRECQHAMNTEKGKESVHEGEIRQAFGLIVAEVEGGAWAAMDIWGTGSKMDLWRNPALEEYMQNEELWNPERHDVAIRGRPAGTYTDIFGNPRESKGTKVGQLLENVPGGKFAPKSPSYAFEVAKRWIEDGRIQEVLQSAMASIPWHTFFVEVRGHCGGR